MGTLFLCLPYCQGIRSLLLYHLIGSEMKHIRRTTSVFFCLQFCCQISCLIDFCLLILAVDVFCCINFILCPCKCSIGIGKLQISSLSGYSCQLFPLLSDDNLPFLFLIFYSQCLCFCYFQIDIVSSCIQFIPFRCSDFLDVHCILRLCQLRFSCPFFICWRHLQNQICTCLIPINPKNSPCKFYTAFCIFFDDLNPGNIHPLNRK